MTYGLIAEHLGHSFSKTIHESFEDYEYELHELPPESLEDFLRERAFRGINVTIPYKQAVIPYLDEFDPDAAAIGAVNTVVNRGGRLYGYNTDFGGMRALIARMGLELSGKKVLILGTGGTSKTALAVAKSLGAGEILRVSRSAREGAVTYGQAARDHTDAQILINTTPSGMSPDGDGRPIDPAVFPAMEGVVDAIFNPLRTELVLSARALGIKAEGGLYMLVAQAILAAQHFTGKTYESGLTDQIYEKLLREKQNLVLIGMPGSGKTTVGRILVERLGRPIADLDAAIVARDGRAITDIFARDGETYFRDLESRITAEVAAQTGQIIATGGGCVLRPENVRRLKRNGTLIFLDRPLKALLPTEDRPLADSEEKLRSLYAARRPVYQAAADVTVSDPNSPEAAADAILSHLEEQP